MGKYLKEIDERDLRRIIDKTSDLELVVKWLTDYAETHNEVKTSENYKRIIRYLNNKIKTLNSKRKSAEDEMQECINIVTLAETEE